jgi:hypothetical protein
MASYSRSNFFGSKGNIPGNVGRIFGCSRDRENGLKVETPPETARPALAASQMPS